VESAEPVKKTSFADKMRKWFRWLLNPIAAFLNRLGLHPNTVTLIGLAGTVGTAVLIARGHMGHNMTWAGLLLLVMGPVDALDGAMARLRGEANAYGAFVDSVTDRYSELFIYLGFLIHYLLIGDPIGVAFTYLAAAGSVLVSYVKARADASKLDANTGLLTRVERYIVLIPGLIFNLPLAVVIIIAILANFTALQRVLRVRRDAYSRLSQK
jgi:CDP-diacylglycerol--glycerol-3-phosphate 3-phosphatidyltransferase